MLDLDKLYLIINNKGDYYKRGKNNNLIKVKTRDEAGRFSLVEANDYISSKKENIYTAIAVDDDVSKQGKEENDNLQNEYVDKYNKFYMFNSDWEELLTELHYMSNNIEMYKRDLSGMISDVDKEICDIMHYLELRDLNEIEMINIVKMLQERRRHRRKIKDEFVKINYLSSTFFDEKLKTKVCNSFSFIEKMKTRKYEPRKLNEIFESQSLIA